MKTQPKIKSFKLAEIKPAKYNPRTISGPALEGLKKSLEKFGLVEPIIVNIRRGKNTIVGGHQRYKGLVELHGGTAAKIQCVTVDLDPREEKLLNIALNNPHIQGEYSDDLAAIIDKLREQMPDTTDLIGLQIEKLRGEIIEPMGNPEFTLPDGEKGDLEQMTFVLSSDQAVIVKEAIKKAKQGRAEGDGVNHNGNGNALAYICENYVNGNC